MGYSPSSCKESDKTEQRGVHVRHKQINEWAWLGFSKTLCRKTGQIWCKGYSLQTPKWRVWSESKNKWEVDISKITVWGPPHNVSPIKPSQLVKIRKNKQKQFKVYENGDCPKGIQQMEKHLYKKINELSVRTVRVSGIWATIYFILQFSEMAALLLANKAWELSFPSGPIQKLWFLPTRGNSSAFLLLSHPIPRSMRQKLYSSTAQTVGVRAPPSTKPLDTHTGLKLYHRRQDKNPGLWVPLPWHNS